MNTKTKPENFNKKFDVVGAFIMHQGKFLILHRQDHKPQGNTWGVPAGKVHSQDKDFNHALSREIFEEVSIKIEPENLKPISSYYVQYPEYDFIYNTFQYNTGEKAPEVILSIEEHKDYKWVTPQEALRLDLIPDEDVCIKDFFKI
jgi:8-oxo-dGTP pyrophosphatase MutT (NUDIX family)